MKQFSAIEHEALVSEFDIQNAKIDGIYHPDHFDFIFRLYQKDKPKKNLRILIPHACYIAKVLPDNPQQPSAWCQYLRKHLSGGSITQIEQIPGERIIIITIQKKDTYQIIVELFGKGNLILTQNDVIIRSLSYKEFSSRSIKRGEKYQRPDLPLSYATANEQNIDQRSEETAVKWLANTLGLSGVYAREICSRLDIEQTTPATDIDPKKLLSVINDIRTLRNPCIVKDKGIKDITPFALNIYQGFEQEEYPTYNEACEQLLKPEKKVRKAENKIQKILDEQEAQVKRLEDQIEVNTKKGDLIYQHYALVSEALKQHKGEFKVELNE